jgi:phosphate transport system substrate-binding protein
MTNGRRWIIAAALTLAVTAGALVFGACGSDSSGQANTPTVTSASTPATPVTSASGGGTIASDVGKDDKATLTGAGSTFAGPLYTRWFTDYQSGVASGVKGNYQAIGSGAGIMNITQKTVDFGATDAPMSDTELGKAPGIQHIPTAIGPVVITYNISGLTQPLRLDGDTLAKIYLGKIKKWNDPALASQNAGASLPNADIIVVHRSDGSGTTYAFTDYLSQISSDWKSSAGTSKNPQWPEGLGGQGNDGVTQQVKQNQNSIGYVELIYADKNSLPKADLKNANGEYVTPSGASTTLAAQGVTLPADYRVSIANSKTPGAYPIATFTWILLYKQQSDPANGKALVDFLWWAIHDGQKTAQQLDYAPLPASVVQSLEGTLKSVTGPDGEPLLQGR